MLNAKPNHLPDLNSENALYQAAANNQLELVSMFLPNANIDEANTLGRTPLHAAAKAGHVAMVELLLANGASMNLKCMHGKTPLMIATIYGHHEVVELLRNHHAALDIVDHDGNTALHLAAKLNWPSIVKILINHSYLPKNDGGIRLVNLFPPIPTADIFLANKQGKKAIDLASNETADLLQEAETLSNNLSEAIKRNDHDTILLCLSSGAKVTNDMIDQTKELPHVTEWLMETDTTPQKKMSLK